MPHGLKTKKIAQSAKLIAFLFIVGGLGAAVFLSQTIQELRQQAQITSSTSSIRLNPASTSLAIGQPQQIQLIAKVQQGIKIDGIQVIGQFSGSIPSNLTFTPSIPSGFNQNPNESIARLTTVGTNRKLELIYIVPPTEQYTTTGQDLILGTFSFTPTSAGQMSFAFDNTLTKITQATVSINLFAESLATVDTYQFVTASPTPTPTPTRTPTPVPSPSPTRTPTPTPGTGGNSPTPTPTPTKTPTPTPTPSPTPTKTPTPTPTFTPTPTPTRTPTPTPTPTNTPSPTPTPLSPATCVASTIPPETGVAPLTVTLHGGGNAGSGGLVGYQWDFENDGNWDTPQNQVSLNPIQHTYTIPGTYNPKYRILDTNGLWSQTCNYNYPVIVSVPNTPTPIPTATTPPVCEGDVNGDLIVEISDYSILVRNFFQNPLLDPEADLNGDGQVELADYSIMVRNFFNDCR